MPYSTYLDTQINKRAFGNTSWTPPATVYIGLSTSTPTKAGTGITEPSGGSYARIALTNDTTTGWQVSAVQPGSGQQQENKSVIQWAQATADWGTIRYGLVYDASSGGNFMAWGVLDVPKAVISGDTVKFNIGALKIVLD